MSTTDDDVAWDNAMVELHHEAMLARAAVEQAIVLFVEGDSEEIALPILLTDFLDEAGHIGLKIANYNGNGSLVAFLKLMLNTLQHPYPIIVTYDDDAESVSVLNRCKAQGLLTDQVFLFPIPCTPVVTYPNGHRGGSFEEAFTPEVFIDAAFSEEILPSELAVKENEFALVFDRTKPWLAQLKKFCAERGFSDWDAKKTILASRLAEKADTLPETFARLIALISEVRKKRQLFIRMMWSCRVFAD